MKRPFPAIVLCALVAAAGDSRGGAEAKTADGREKLPIAPGRKGIRAVWCVHVPMWQGDSNHAKPDELA